MQMNKAESAGVLSGQQQWMVTVVLIIAGFCAAGQVFAQQANLTEAVPQESFLGEQFCFTTEFTNDGDTGFGPYVRLVLPPLLQFDSASVFGGGDVNFIGEFPVDPDPQVTETELTDPRISEPVIGPEGFSYRNIVLPVGSLVDGAPPLPIDICVTIDPDAIVGDPLPIDLQPVYEFGDTATGANGPIVGNVVEQEVVPTVLVFDKTDNAPESERPPGSSWPYTYTLSVDIANTATIDPITISDTLPADFLYEPGSATIVAGDDCSVIQEPDGLTPGGSLEVECGENVGTTGGGDVVVTYSGHIVDILDESICQTSPIINDASVTATYIDQANEENILPAVSDNTQVTAEHVAIQKSASPGQATPGQTIDYSYAIQITDFGNVSDLVITDVLGDGIDFDDQSVTVSVDGGPSVAVTPDVTVNNDTTVVMDLLAATGLSQFDAGTAISVSYQGTVRQDYRETGEPVRASDSLPNSVVATYDLVEGATACTEGSSASVGIIPIVIDKSVVDQQNFYEPGDNVVFRLRMEVPSGDTRNIQFLDFLPLPVLQVTDVDTDFSTDPSDCPGSAGICLTENDTLDFTPDDIIINPTQNSIQIDWPDVDTEDPQVIEIDLYTTVTDDPFADGLFLTNIFQVFTANTPGDIAAATGPVQILVGAPALELTKGVIGTDGDGVIAPAPGDFPENSNISDVEAGDEITFRLTVENMGRSPAFEVTLFDDVPDGLTGCSVDSVTNQAGDSLDFSGNLFDIGSQLELDDPLPGLADPPDQTNVAFIDFTCEVAIGVQPEQELTNFAVGAYTSQPDGPEFPPIDDEADIEVASVDLTKSLVASSEAHTSDTASPPELTIGEIARYRLVTQIPRGTMPNFEVEDLLPNGLQFLDDETATVALVSASGGNITSSTLSGTGLNVASTDPDVEPTFEIPASAISGGPFGSGFNPTFSLGEIVNEETGEEDEWIVIEFNALVLNTGGNSAGTNRDNRFRVDVDGSQVGSDSNNQRIRVVEPAISVDKSANPTGGQAGTVISYQIDLSVASGTNSADAFDVSVDDTLPANATLNTGSAAVTNQSGCDSPDITNNTAGNTVAFEFDTLPTGCTLSVVYEATLTIDVVPGTTVNNTANVDWESLPDGGTTNNPTDSDTPGGPGDGNGARQYDGSDSAQVTIDSVDNNKLVVDSTEAHTSGNDLAIGEIVTYRLVIELPQGTSPDFTVIDTLDPGLVVDGNTLRLAFVANDGGIESDDPDIGTSPQVTGNDPNVTPTFEIPSGAVTVSGDEQVDGQTVTFSLGTLTNSDDDADSEWVVIEFDALLLNIAGNQAGVTRDNQFTVEIDGEQNGDASNVETITVVEPDIEGLTKTASPDSGEAGDEIDFTVSFTVAGGANTADAFDLVVDDELPSEMELNLGSIEVDFTDCPGAPAENNQSSGNQVLLEFAALPTGCNLQIDYTAELLVDVNPGQPLENTADVTWTSLPGDRGTDDATPGTPGAVNGERTGEGGANDDRNNYADSASAEVDIDDVVLTKTAISGSEDSTDLPDAAIGETITYRVVITLPQGTTPEVTLTDQVPHDSGGVMELLSAEVITGGIGSNLTVTNPSGDPSGDPPPLENDRLNTLGLNDTVTFNFGEVVNPPGGPADENQIEVEITARVNNLSENESGDQLTNVATVQFGPDLTATDSADIDLVEPELIISKVGDITSGDAGDLVEFTIQIGHAGASTADAQNVVFVDDLPSAELVYQTGTVGVDGYDVDVVIDDTDGIITIEWPEFPQGESATITYQAVLDDAVQSGSTITNTGELDWTSLQDDTEDENRDYSDSDTHDIVISDPGVNKFIFDTSEGSTDDPNLTIGETVTWHIEVEFAQGLTPNAVFVDELPSSVDFELVSSQVFSIGSNLAVPGVSEGDAGVHDTGDDTVTWSLGGVNNPPGSGLSAEDQRIVFEVVAVVLDTSGNQSGDSATNRGVFTADTLDDPVQDTSTISLVDPRLSFNKSVADPSSGFVNAGDTVTFDLAISHTAASTADAFSVVMVDSLPGELNWVPGSATDDCDGTVTVDDSDTSEVEFTLDTLELGDSCTITYEVEVDISAEAGTSFTNSVSADYDSTPDFVEDQTRRRSDTTSDQVTMRAPTLIKVSFETGLSDTGTGQHDPNLDDLAIGELITYAIDVVVPPGTTSDAVVTDFLPSDPATGVIEADSAQVFNVGDGITISQAMGDIITISDSNANGFDDTVVFDFDEVVAGINSSEEDRTITLRVTGRVVDVPGNVDEVVLINRAEFDFFGNPDDPLADTADIEVVEPELEIEKSMTPRGDGVVRIALRVENTGTGPAYDFEITDVLSEVDWDLDSLQVDTVPSNYQLTTESSASELTVTFQPDSGVGLLPGVSRTATFDISLANNPPAADANNPIVNQANLDNACSFPEGCNQDEPEDNIGRDQDPDDDSDELGFPALSLDKSVELHEDADSSGDVSPGDTLRYTLVLENNGAAEATDLIITDTPDPRSSLVVGSVTTTAGTVVLGNSSGQTSVRVELASLADSETLTVTYDVVLDDPFPASVDEVENQAVARSFEQPDLTDEEVTPVVASPELFITKTDGGVTAVPGGGVVYTLEYGNVGNQDATGVVITDVVPDNVSFDPDNSDAGFACTPDNSAGSTCTLSIGDLDVGDGGSVSFAVIVDDPLPAGVDSIANLAEITDDGSNSPEPVTDEDDENTPIDADAVLAISKSLIEAIPAPADIGSVLRYEIEVWNDGNMTLTDVVISDPLVDPIDPVADCQWDGDVGTLRVDESVTCAVEYTVTPADADAGEVENTATADSEQTGPVDDDETVTITPEAGLQLIKSASPTLFAAPGEVEYSFIVQNIGNVTLSDVAVDDPMLGGPIACEPSVLAAGATASCGPVTHSITQSDVDSGEDIVNVATARGITPDETVVDDNDDATVEFEGASPALQLVKEASTEGPVAVDEEIEYTLTATNTGNVTLTEVVITDDMIDLSCEPELPATLAPEESVTCSGVYMVEASDLGGDIVNTASVTGLPPEGESVGDDDEISVSGMEPIPVPVGTPTGLLLLMLIIGAIGAGCIGWRRRLADVNRHAA
ncbi:isopeptide-forming domain-containing fimbrial protein [Wenzhouxiangella sp. AB-CW3]|uniref:isopeptide-forming domain-containing fimbrial protein n=1 Tax=Wenzhouxiangella sp. AB-CW3 TaxID=2771012 RepID=UPI00168B5585|nr:isopeptide-forming domain-containing fimbrial protein [Wenzhouxiangella sp. AB-CW3]QOC22164.1 isopeptide-forming domain-containing fimbrial protein [Wenzhouxiangella sp. AB-CW3]